MNRKPIPYGKQQITQADIDAVEKVLKSDFLTQGPAIASLEEAFGKYIGCEHTVAVSSGTAALHLSVMALGIQPGEKVLTSPLTFSASANCVEYCRGEILFADVDPETGLIDLAEVESILSKEHIAGVIPVDYAGLVVDLEKLRSMTGEKTWIVEDACHAPGGWARTTDGKENRAGSCQYSDAAIFSFHPVKHIAAGEGGMMMLNSQELRERAAILRTHGISKDHLTSNDETPWYYEMLELGYNYRMTDIHAALASSQLQQAEKKLQRRKEIASIYNTELKELPLQLPKEESLSGHALHLYVIRTDQRDQLYHYLHKKGILVQVHYVPVHWMPFYQKKGWKKGQFPKAEKFYSQCLSLPMFPSLTTDEQQYTIETIKEFFA